MTARPKRRLRRSISLPIVIAAAFVIAGITALSLTGATTHISYYEAEAGSRSDPAKVSVGSDPEASDGAFVTFGGVDTPPPPPVGGSLLKPAKTFTKRADLRYSNASPRLLLDLYLPDHDSAKPLIAFIHGGGWVAGSKESCFPAENHGRGTFMHRGFAVACINYRLSGEASYPAQIEDVKASIRWLRANATKYGLYGDKVAVWGESAGGHLAALAGTTSDIKQYDKGDNLQFSSAAQAVVDFFGPSDLTNSDQPGEDPKDNALVVKLLGGAGPDLEARARAASPVTYVTADDAPFHIVHGDQDRIVPLSQSRLLDKILTQAKVSSDLHIIAGMGHGGQQLNEPARLDAIASFLDLYIH